MREILQNDKEEFFFLSVTFGMTNSTMYYYTKVMRGKKDLYWAGGPLYEKGRMLKKKNWIKALKKTNLDMHGSHFISPLKDLAAVQERRSSLHLSTPDSRDEQKLCFCYSSAIIY